MYNELLCPKRFITTCTFFSHRPFSSFYVSLLVTTLSNICPSSVHAWWKSRNPPVTGGFPSQRQVTQALMLSLICAWTNGWAKNRDAGDLRHHGAHYDVTVTKRSARKQTSPHFYDFFFILSCGCYNLDNFQHNQWRKFRQMIIHFPCDKYMATIEWRHMSANTCNFNDQYIALSIDHSNTREIVPKVNFCLRVGQGVVVSHNRIWLISMPSRLFFSESYQSSQNIWPATHDFSPDGFWEMRNGIKLHPTAKYDT